MTRRIPLPLRHDELRAHGEPRYGKRASFAGDRGENPPTPTPSAFTSCTAKQGERHQHTDFWVVRPPQITFEAVFRRNYDWGRLQMESVRTPPAMMPLLWLS
jgi:hypothetical protein